MSTAIATIPANLPAHVSSLFAQLGHLNKEAAEGIGIGIGIGMHPFIKLSGTRFVLVKDGEEKTVKSLELKVVVLRAKQGFEKRYYAEAYDPNAGEAKAPDCHSSDGIKPAAGCSNPQNASCAGCPQNQFGSGVNQNGEPTKGKACSDRKQLAVLYPNPDTKELEVYGLSLPPASLKAFGAYVNLLTTNNIPLPAAFTTIGFDEKASYPVLTFSFGGVMGEKEAAQVIPMIDGPEVKAIIDSQIPAVSPVAPALANTVEEPKPVKEKKLKAVEKPEPVAQAVPEEQEDGDLSDSDLAGMLGLNL